MWVLSVASAQNTKTLFTFSDLFQSSGASNTLPTVQNLCRLHIQSNPGDHPVPLIPMLRQKCDELRRLAGHTASFEKLLACTQSLLLLQCVLILDDQIADDGPYSETANNMLSNAGRRLWQQVPIQLSHTLSPRKAWLCAESVRRTVIVAFLLCNMYSLPKGNYSVRTPSIDSLSFDVRTSLWDAEPESLGMHGILIMEERGLFARVFEYVGVW